MSLYKDALMFPWMQTPGQEHLESNQEKLESLVKYTQDLFDLLSFCSPDPYKEKHITR